MKWKGKSRKTVFILGAGATRGAFKHVSVNRKRIKPPLNRDFFDVLGTLAKAEANNGRVATRFRRLKKALESDFPARSQCPVPMETAFSLLYVSKDFPKIFSGAAGRPRQAGTRIEIEDFLRLTFSLLNTIARLAPEGNLYDKLTQDLEPEDVLITLNYDTVLDRALLSEGWNPIRGYDLIGGEKKFKWGMAPPQSSAHLDRVKLLKLHGSVNWFVKGRYDEIQKVFGAKPSQVVLSDVPGSNEVNGFIRQIIPPIYGKFFQHSHWQHLWHSAFKAVVDADLIVVVGCSLIDSDFHLTGILSRAMREKKRKRKKFYGAILVDRLRVRKKWIRLLKGRAESKYPYTTFKQFANTFSRRARGIM